MYQTAAVHEPLTFHVSRIHDSLFITHLPCMLPALKKLLERFLGQSNNNYLRRALLRILYARKGMAFQGWKNFSNRFYLLRVDGCCLPTEQPFWNVTKEQYRLNCKKVSLHFCDIEKGDAVIDIGAGLGEEAIIYSSLAGAEGKVYCMEPFPPAFEVLSQVVSCNRLTNVQLYRNALFHSSATINIADDSSSYSTVHIAKGKGAGYEVQGISFGELMQQVREPEIKFMKVNIEGAERYLLDPLFLPYFQRISHIAIACHDFRYRHEGNLFFLTRQIVTDFFIRYGFQVRSQQTGEAFLDDWLYISRRDP